MRCLTGGGAQIRPAPIDLDAQDLVAQLASGEGEFVFTVAQGETETFLVSANTASPSAK